MHKLVLAIAAAIITLLAAAREARAEPCNADPNTSDKREICIERDIFLMPGVQAIVFAPRGEADPFVGGGVQIAPLHWSHNNDKFGPSQGAIFVGASLLQSRSTDGAMAIYELGFSLSLERNSSRRFLIPYFGSSFGGTIHSELPNGGFAYPFAGIHLYWHHNLVVNLEGGYHFPFADIDELRGPRAQLTVRFSMW